MYHGLLYVYKCVITTDLLRIPLHDPFLNTKCRLKALAIVVIPILHNPLCQRFPATSFFVSFFAEKKEKRNCYF